MLEIFSIISIFIVYWSTNLQNKNLDTSLFFIHEQGSVCPFGILMGKIYTFLLIIQLLLITYKNYKFFKKIFLFISFISIILSFLNFNVLKNIIYSFFIQLLIYIKY